MSAALITLGNKERQTVQLPEELAMRLFGRLKKHEEVMREAGAHEDVADVEDAEETRPKQPEEEELKLEELDCPLVALEVIRDYALRSDEERTQTIPQPLDRSMDNIVRADEMAMLRKAASEKYLTPLLETALYLQFEQLSNMCAAYTYEEIERIAKVAPDIMTGAENIRQFLNIKNEWTEEEMGHLRKEMEFAKELDPNAY